MRSSIIVLISVVIVGSIVIFLGFTNQEYIEISEITSQYEKLQQYKDELERINQNNQKLLDDLEEQITNSDDVHLEQINEEIEIIKQVINKNKEELEKIIKKLSEIEPKP